MPMDSPTAEVDVFGDGFAKTLEDALPEIITRTCEKCNREIMHEMVTVSRVSTYNYMIVGKKICIADFLFATSSEVELSKRRSIEETF